MLPTLLALMLVAPGPAAPAIAAVEWRPLETADFAVSLPGAPVATQSVEENGAMTTSSWALQTPNAYFAVSATDFQTGTLSNAEPSRILAASRDEALTSAKAVLEKDAAVFLEGAAKKKKYEGREFFANAPTDVRLATRLFVVDDRLYQLMMASTKSGFNEDAFRKFVDSFKLKKPAPTPPSRPKK